MILSPASRADCLFYHLTHDLRRGLPSFTRLARLGIECPVAGGWAIFRLAFPEPLLVTAPDHPHNDRRQQIPRRAKTALARHGEQARDDKRGCARIGRKGRVAPLGMSEERSFVLWDGLRMTSREGSLPADAGVTPLARQEEVKSRSLTHSREKRGWVRDDRQKRIPACGRQAEAPMTIRFAMALGLACPWR